MNRSGLAGWGIMLLRVTVAVIFIVHGGQKLFVYGLGGVGQSFGQMGIPAPAIIAALVAIIEFFGGLALLLGFFTRYAALLIAAVMAGAVLLVHSSKGFFVSSGGFEFALLLLVASLTLAMAGPGALSIDGSRRGASGFGRGR
ncbi:MAG TPA: DoxX family protein [Bryobacteraceae bacterium]|nr:DoxX family protein [Bryobacteraceae bacterium]